MTKRLIKFFTTLLTLLFAAVLLAGVVQAAVPANTLQVTFTYDSTECQGVTVYVDGRLQLPTSEGSNTYEIGDHFAVYVVLTPKTGYVIASLTNDAGQPVAPLHIRDVTAENLGGTDPATISGSVYRFTFQAATNDFTVNTVEADYTIKEQSGVPSTGQMVFDEISYSYKQVEPVQLPVPTLDGYDFEGWWIDDNATVKFFIPYEGKENYVLFDTGKCPLSGTKFYATPQWKGQPQTVTRYDHEYGENVPVNYGNYAGTDHCSTVLNTVNGDTTVTGKNNGVDETNYKTYVGYYDFAEYADVVDKDGNPVYYTVCKIVKPAPAENKVYRYYVPITYTLTYAGLEGTDKTAADYPTTHIYNQPTDISGNPTRKGYDFAGWKVSIMKNGVLTDVTAQIGWQNSASNDSNRLTARCMSLAEGNEDETIVLEAQWTPKTYNVTVNAANGTAPATLTYTYNQDLTVPMPIRTGYTFKGWIVEVNGEAEADANMTGVLPANTYTSDITMTAVWEAKTYSVTLNGNGATVAGSDKWNFTYDAPLVLDNLKLPQREGHTFLGFFTAAEGGTKYINADGTAAVTAWALDGDALSLYAQWSPIDYDVTIDAPNATVTVNGTPYTGTVKFPYGTVLQIIVKANEYFTVTDWCGNAVDLTDTYTATATVGVGGLNLSATVRPKAPVYNSTNGDIVDVRGYDLDKLLIEWNSALPQFFVYEIACSPIENDPNLVWVDLSTLQDPNNANRYLITADYRGKALTPGTYYYVSIRAKETDSHPYGEAFVTKTYTLWENYLTEKINALNNLLTEDDGDITKELIADAIEQARALGAEDELSPTFYADLTGIYNTVLAKLEFARTQDRCIATLIALRDELISTGSFSAENQTTLTSKCDAAVNSIKAMTVSGEVEALAAKTADEMRAIRITYLFHEQLTLTAFAGLPQGTKLLLSRINDLSELTALVDAAIANGNFAPDGQSMTLAEASELLSELDVMGAWGLYLNLDSSKYTDFEGKYHFRLLLPEDLRSITGLQIAYYDAGTLVVLDTVRDGSYLEFEADRVTDFILLGDPTMNLTGLIIALGLALACQLIAIILLMARRAKNAKAANTRHAVTVLPTVVALTVRFLPANGLQLALILGIAVVVCQIILMYLLLSSDVVRGRKDRTPSHADRRDREDETPDRFGSAEDGTSDAGAAYAMATVFAEDAVAADDAETFAEETDPFVAFDDGEGEYEEVSEGEDASEEYAEEYEEEYAEGYAEEDLPAEASEEYEYAVAEDTEDGAEAAYDEDVFVNLNTGEVFGDPDGYGDEFIEPAVDPRYSLPEDETAPAEDVYAETPAEEYADVQASEEYSEEYPEEVSEGYADAQATEAYTEGYAEAPIEGYQFEPDPDPVSDEPEQLDIFSIPTEEASMSDADAPQENAPADAETVPEEEIDEFDGDARGEPAEDLPQEEPVTGICPPYETE